MKYAQVCLKEGMSHLIRLVIGKKSLYLVQKNESLPHLGMVSDVLSRPCSLPTLETLPVRASVPD